MKSSIKNYQRNIGRIRKGCRLCIKTLGMENKRMLPKNKIGSGYRVILTNNRMDYISHTEEANYTEKELKGIRNVLKLDDILGLDVTGVIDLVRTEDLGFKGRYEYARVRDEIRLLKDRNQSSTR